jgi:hypothetical protein
VGLDFNGRAGRVDNLDNRHSLDNLGEKVLLSTRF